MKKLAITIVIVLGLGISAFADGGLFQLVKGLLGSVQAVTALKLLLFRSPYGILHRIVFREDAGNILRYGNPVFPQDTVPDRFSFQGGLTDAGIAEKEEDRTQTHEARSQN